MTTPPLRILHISDLHFTGRGRPLVPDTKIRLEAAAQALTDDASDRFLKDFEGLLTRELRGAMPAAVIVTGDLVDRGGADSGEFARARKFLKALAKLIGIRDERVFVVPGNHDIDWSRGIDQQRKFTGYIDAVADFSSPTFSEGIPQAFWETRAFSEGIKAQLLLLASPTFSGVPNPDVRSLLNRLQGVLRDLKAEEQQRLANAIEAEGGLLDIGAIGSVQRRCISQHPDDPTSIRIAVLHHHLLPHPHVELGPFESVVDAGQTLRDLINQGFDLVLTGHKHNRQLVQYRQGDRAIDVYTGPSLFEGQEPGFTIIETHGANQPIYATLRYFSLDCKEKDQLDLLVRSGRVLPKVTRLCANIDTKDQETRLIAALGHLGDAFAWARETEAPVELFEKVWRDQIMGDLEDLAHRRLIFRPPYLKRRWQELIALAQRRGGSLKLVSLDDRYFWEGLSKEGSFCEDYAAPIRDFNGDKHRILVISRYELDDRTAAVQWADIVKRMLADRLTVSVVYTEIVKGDIDDFGIIGDFGISKFNGRGLETRALEESFAQDDVELAKEKWSLLLDARRWSSERNDGDFLTWLQRHHPARG
jgi:3',5'-cyclic AMP phosphodiesterase CpdA